MTSIGKVNLAAGVISMDELAQLEPGSGLLAVLGDPIAHSLSPAMHNAALAAMAAEHPELNGWRYCAVHVPDGQLAVALERLLALGFRGINLTIPHKVAAFQQVAEVSAFAQRSGAVNTLIASADGFRGGNTDGFGIVTAIEEQLGLSLEQRDLWLLGAGGAARAITVACMDAGARRISVVNRSVQRLDELRGQIAGIAADAATEVRFLSTAEALWDVEEGAVAINATALGLHATDPSPLEEQNLRRFAAVYDTTYGAANQLSAHCGQLGITYADGLSMLVWQGVRSLELWTGRQVPADVMAAAARAALEKRRNNG